MADPVSIIGGAALGGITSLIGQNSANQANRAMSREQMNFQERMSSTAWQRGVADMRKAGINPMLAVSQGGASAPSGSQSTTQPTTTDLPRHISSAIDALRLKKEIEATESQIDLNKASAANAQANAAFTGVRTQAEVANLPTAEADAAFRNSWYGKLLYGIDKTADTAGSVIGIGRKLFGSGAVSRHSGSYSGSHSAKSYADSPYSRTRKSPDFDPVTGEVHRNLEPYVHTGTYIPKGKR